MLVRCIAGDELVHFLKRELHGQLGTEEDLQHVLIDILRRTGDFVPAESGALYLDDPVLRSGTSEEPPCLVRIACIGRSVGSVGERLLLDDSLLCRVYLEGRSMMSPNPVEQNLEDGWVNTVEDPLHSILCVPLTTDSEVIGVLELRNRLVRRTFRLQELKLLEMLARSLSGSIAQAIEAQQAREMAKRDDLTGLANDRHLHRSLSRIIARCLGRDEDCGLIFLDLDHFKSINDQHGHLAGSRVLAQVGKILRQILPGQALPSRYGGDEFVICIPGFGRQELGWVAETVRKNIEEFVFLSEPDPAFELTALNIGGVITCSVGLATLQGDVLPNPEVRPGNESIKNELLRAADQAMYRAKAEGRNRIVTAWG